MIGHLILWALITSFTYRTCCIVITLSAFYVVPQQSRSVFLVHFKCLHCWASYHVDSAQETYIVVQSLSCVSSVQSLFVTPWTAPHQASLSFFTISQSLLKHISIESVMPSNHLILCYPLLLLLSIFPTIRVFSNEPALHMRWPKYCLSFNISPSNEHPGLISFRMDQMDLLDVQGTLKSLL